MIWRLLVVTSLTALIAWAAATDTRAKKLEAEQQTRRIAVEEACRTIVEAGLVASCGENSLHSKQ